MKLALFSILLIGLLVSGCLSSPASSNTDTTNGSTSIPEVKNPSFTISSPLNGETIQLEEGATSVVIRFTTQDLILKNGGGAAKKGEGHFRITIDGGSPITSWSKTYEITNIEEGSHTVKVELLNNDNTPYQLSRTITFTVAKAQPDVYVPQQYTVTIKDLRYDPAELSVKVGDEVMFVNAGSFPASATCFINGMEIFDTDVLAPGESAKITMAQAMYCEYYSTTHRAMQGQISVQN